MREDFMEKELGSRRTYWRGRRRRCQGGLFGKRGRVGVRKDFLDKEEEGSERPSGKKRGQGNEGGSVPRAKMVPQFSSTHLHLPSGSDHQTADPNSGLPGHCCPHTLQCTGCSHQQGP